MSIRCHVTGVAIEIDDAYLLHTGRAGALLRQARERVEMLERLIGQLGGSVEVRVPGPSGKPRVIKQRKLVSRAVAQALSAAEADTNLFTTWADFRKRMAVQRLTRLSSHPIYGAQLASVSSDGLSRIAAKGRILCHMMKVPGNHTDLRLALEIGVQLALPDLDPIEQFERILAAGVQGRLCDCGIPTELHRETIALSRQEASERAMIASPSVLEAEGKEE